MTLTKIGFSLIAVSFLSASPANTVYVQKCASCHGTNGDMKAMGTSNAIKDMSVASIEKAMLDIVSGEKKSMNFVKSVKEDFMRKHSKEELHELAIYIHGLKEGKD